MTRRLVHTRSLPREESANPHVPRGINVKVELRVVPVAPPPAPGAIGSGGQPIFLTKNLNAEPREDLIGQVSFAVDQDFGLALYAPPIAATGEMSRVAAGGSLQRIGGTGAIARTYEVSDLGDVEENGTALHHLALRPLREPRRNRLRELWIDANTALPVHAVVAGIGNRGPLQDVMWKVDFTQFQGGTYLAREVALEPLAFGRARVDEVTITFERLRTTNRLSPLESLGLSAEVGTTDPG